jgi:hypothetical protein
MDSEISTLLRQIPLFAGFDEDALQRLGARSVLRA